MSHSPERISSYRRHFEDAGSMSVQVRVSSPSPVRRETHHRSASYSAAAAHSVRAGSVGRRTISSTRKLPMAGANPGALSVTYGTESSVDLDAAAAENQKFLSTRSSERKEMVLLNDRLAAYIEKVRSLEQHNKLLESETEALRTRFLKSSLRSLYEEQLKELMKVADRMKVQRDLAVAAKEAMAGQLEILKAKYEEAVEQRRRAEADVDAFRPDVDAATSARIALEKQLEQLETDIEFLQRVQKQEIDDLMKEIYSAHATTRTAFALPDLSTALKQIQAQYDDIAAKNLQEMDAWYSSKFEDLTNKSTKNMEKVRSVREEMNIAKKDILNKERDVDALRTKNDILESRIREANERHKNELDALEARMEALQSELRSTKEKMALILREYQELLNVKMSLEVEITTYRKLIEGEDGRLTGAVQNLSLMGSSSVSAVGASVSVNGVGSNGVGSNGVGGKCSAGNGGGSLVVDGNGGGSNDTGVSNAAANGGATDTQAVEVTERKTTLIRTVRNERDVVERDMLEQTVTITGAADGTEFD